MEGVRGARYEDPCFSEIWFRPQPESGLKPGSARYLDPTATVVDSIIERCCPLCGLGVNWHGDIVAVKIKSNKNNMERCGIPVVGTYMRAS